VRGRELVLGEQHQRVEEPDPLPDDVEGAVLPALDLIGEGTPPADGAPGPDVGVEEE
jgi:hypothetical protein